MELRSSSTLRSKRLQAAFGVLYCVLGMALTLIASGCRNMSRSGALAQAPPTGTASMRRPLSEASRLPVVSMYSIVAEPERFDGCQVITAGFVSVAEGVTVLALNQEAVRYGLFMNKAYLDLSQCINRRKVLDQAEGKCCWFKVVVDAKSKRPEDWDVEYACTLRALECTIIHKGE
jgi:hypothetical protein